jgi:hypothetical protein
MEMRSKMPGNCWVAPWLGVGLGALGTLNAVLSIGNLMPDISGVIRLDGPARSGPIFVVVQASTFLALTGGGFSWLFRYEPDTN